jgi:hypothetical protein
VLHLGGYAAVGAASVAVCVLGAAVGRSFPEHGRTTHETDAAAEEHDDRQDDGQDRQGGHDDEPGMRAVLRAGAGELRASRPARGAVLLTCVVTGFLMIDEYIPLLIKSMDVDAAAVPPLLLLVTAGVAVGGWCAGRGARLLAPALAVGALALAAGAVSGPPGAALLAVAFGIFQWAMVTCDARLQDAVTDRARATLTSVAGFGAEVVSVLLCAGYALGSQLWAHSTLFVLAAVPYLLIALVLAARGRSSSGAGRKGVR